MNSRFSISLFAVLTAAALLHLQIIPAAVATPSSAKDTEFIRTNCQTTLHADVCFRLLSRYANQIQQDSAKLARVAIAVSLSRVKRMANYVNNLSRDADNGADPETAAALHQCFSVFDDAVDEIRDSLNEMRHLGGSGESLKSHLSNVQTWMSSAMTDEETCLDGFEDAEANGPIKSDVTDKTKAVETVTSVALALVNRYAQQVTTW